ncbi:patatin-domain-containing protein [Exidia glandulosa HHB12029]|uniref:Patatin-like phospholipase domain-containing protein n=1 Tax=Exidia glandulosa HHB12029 TaxID=1314781 RepID=A0A165QSM9_EXIGL|nr:patatin-domain-containing protein [Exidia glandulosa HHB12029]
MPSSNHVQDDALVDRLFNASYVNEDHILAFEQALQADDESLYDTGPELSPRDGLSRQSSYSGSLSQHQHPPVRVRKVSALSDFAPINTRVRRRRKGDRAGYRGREWGYHIVRWPLLFFLFLWIFGEFGLYVFIRQVVNAIEWLFAWSGRKGLLRRELRRARTYQQWKDAAQTMDEYMGFDLWKKEDEDPYYDWTLVKKVRRSLRSFREKDDARGVLGVLEVCLRANFAGTESGRLYSETFYGTKNLVESYISEVEQSLVYVRRTPKLSIEEKRRFFRVANRNLGSSALCLSGGASFGYYHIGLVKAFLDANLIPRVIAGTSAGGLIAALIGTRTDEELRQLLVPRLADNLSSTDGEPFRVWFKRFRQTGARFDSVAWARKACWFTKGSTTFKEAYEATGRVLNISVIPFDRHSPTKLLNYLTAPDCVIWSALLASAAVPGILNPVVLMQKTRSGDIIPWSYGSRFKDGSLRVDIPLQSLNLLFNVNFPIVSQVNPHVHLFFFAPRGSAGRPVAHRKGKGWRGGFILSAAEQYLKHDLTKNFKVIRDLELLPQLLGQDWSSVFLQRFDGVVTIWPKTRMQDWLHILSDPDRDELERMMRVGEGVAWPKLHMIENRFRLEREILRGRLYVRRALRAKSPVPASALENGQDSANAAGPSDSGPTPFPKSEDKGQVPIESDAETAFANGEQRFFKKHRLSPSLNITPAAPEKNGVGEHATIAQRRKGTGNHLTPSPLHEESRAQSPVREQSTVGRASGFLSRFKTKSLSSFTSPFGTFTGGGRRSRTKSITSSIGNAADEPWSSDSSSVEDDLVENDFTPPVARGGDWMTPFPKQDHDSLSDGEVLRDDDEDDVDGR